MVRILAGRKAHQPLQQQARDRVGVLMHFSQSTTVAASVCRK